MKQRLIASGGDEYEQASKVKTTVDKYWDVKDKQYQEYQRQQQKLELKAIENF